MSMNCCVYKGDVLYATTFISFYKVSINDHIRMIFGKVSSIILIVLYTSILYILINMSIYKYVCVNYWRIRKNIH